MIDFSGSSTTGALATVDSKARQALKGHRPLALWLTGIPASGKSTLARHLEARLHQMGLHTYLLDGDELRLGLNGDLGFTEADRNENIRRTAEVARLMVDAGLIVIAALITPLRQQREFARSLFPRDQFIEVFVDTSPAVAEARDPKGHYRKARSGSLPFFTGIDSPYEAPTEPDIHIDGGRVAPEAAVDIMVIELQRRGVFRPPSLGN